MPAPRPLSASVLICTFNRADLLRETLESMRPIVSARPWSIVVVDNNSSDGTRAVVDDVAATLPVPVDYVFEPRQGKSYALNTGLERCNSDIVVFTDDDVRVGPEWLLSGARALAGGADYVGGPVIPIWAAPPPAWLDLSRSDLWGTIAILDYGGEPFAFEDRQRVPLGANMGFRRSLVSRVGGFRSDLGRTNGRRVLGQEVPELLARARGAALRGVYVPAMAVHHHIPAGRLTKRYYWRWWIGKGYSKAILEAVQPITEMGLDLREVPHIGSIPRFMVSDALRDVVGYVRAWIDRDPCERSRREMRLAYLIGYIRGRGLGRRRPAYPAADERAEESRASAGFALSPR